MALVVLAAAAALFLRLWIRLVKLEGQLDALGARVEELLEPSRRDLSSRATRRQVEAVQEGGAPAQTAASVPAFRTEVRTKWSSEPANGVGTETEVWPRETSDRSDPLEERIGSRWLLYAGIVAVIVGVSFFEKLAIDNHWIGEAARVVQGALTGLALVGAGRRLTIKGYTLYGRILAGGGVAVLYVATYAAFSLYHLIAQPVAFALMSAITALAAALADRERSLHLALVAVVGGFATPFLLPTGADSEITLFGYDSILIAGTMFLAGRRTWPLLNLASYIFTGLTVTAWASAFYVPSKYLTTELFLTLFCGMFLNILRQVSKRQDSNPRLQSLILATAPLTYYFASLLILTPHSTALLVYLVLLTLICVIAISIHEKRLRFASLVRSVCWMATAMPLLLWSDGHGTKDWLLAGLASWSGIYLLHFVGLLKTITSDQGRTETPLPRALDLGLVHANALVAFAGTSLLLDPFGNGAIALAAVTLAGFNAAIAQTTYRKAPTHALHFVALAFTFLAVATAVQFDGAWVVIGWATEGAVLTCLGLRTERHWLRNAGLALFGIAIGQLFDLQGQAFSPRAGELLLFNMRAAVGLYIVTLTYILTAVHHRVASITEPLETGIGLVTANILLLSVAATEITAYWHLHPFPPFKPVSQVMMAALTAGFTTVWLGLHRRQEWMRHIGLGLVATAALGVFSLELRNAPLEYVTILNSRALVGFVTVLLFCSLAALHLRCGAHLRQLQAHVAALITSASLFTLSLLTSEINAFWVVRGASVDSYIAREAMNVTAWAAVGGFLIWNGLSQRQMWIRVVGAVLFVTAVLRLLNLEFIEVLPGYTVVANPRILASLVLIGLCYGLARAVRATDRLSHNIAGGLDLLANLLTLTLLTSEITAYWHLQDLSRVAGLVSDSQFAREMTLSVTWAVYAALLSVVGLRTHYSPIRYFALCLFVLTIVKVFAVDMAELDRLYRVVSVLVLGIMLLVTSFLYQRIHLSTRTADET